MNSLAMVDREAMPVHAWRGLLSSREQAEVLTFTGARVDRTVTSRVLVKYLTVCPGGPAYRQLRAEHIGAISHDVMSGVEALSGPAGKRRPATVIRSGQALEQAASSAHCGKFTAAVYGRGRLGLDLERIETRRPEFYRQMFSDAEHDWVESRHADTVKPRDAAFTFLWAVKEAFLKASNWPGLTVWSFSRWSVRVGDEVATILGAEPVATSVSIRGRMESAGVAQPIDIRARRVGDMLLVAVQYDDSGDKGTVFL